MTTHQYNTGALPILGDPGAASRDDVIFSGDRCLYQAPYKFEVFFFVQPKIHI